jgi:NAD+ diphosphatase
MLDRVAMRRSDAEFVKAKLAASGARVLLLADLKPVIRSNAERTTARLAWFSSQELAGFGLPVADALFLGVDAAGNGHFALAVTEHRTRLVSGAIETLRPIVDLRSLAMQGAMSREELSLCGQARALAQWHENARCCGHCGGQTLVKDGGWRRKCWACGLEWFPRTDPVVIMLISDGERCLLAHEHRYGDKMYSALAGYVEPGEDVEHAVRREVLEETNVKVGAVTYHSSQPWPFPHSLMIGCHGRAESTEITIDSGEIAEARWFSRDEARQMLERRHPEGLHVPGRQAIANVLIAAFVDAR